MSCNTGTVVEQRYNNRHRELGTPGHWFETDTLRFFRSRIGVEEVVPTGMVFVSSEKNTGLYADYPRLYSVRRYTHETGDISTVGEFQEHTTRAQAVGAMRRLAKKENAQSTGKDRPR